MHYMSRHYSVTKSQMLMVFLVGNLSKDKEHDQSSFHVMQCNDIRLSGAQNRILHLFSFKIFVDEFVTRCSIV